jgi:hypothetical protein
LVLLASALAASALAAPAPARDTGSPASTTARFSRSFDSPEALAQEFLRLLEAGDPEAAKPLALSEQEFKEIVWPEMPAARPERNVPVDFAWDNMWPKSLYGLARTFQRHGGKRLELVAVRFEGETTAYSSFDVRRDARCVVRNASGEEQTLDLFGSVLVDGDRYKLFSFVVD